MTEEVIEKQARQEAENYETIRDTSILYYRNQCRKCGKIFKTILPFNVICKKCTNKKNKIERKISKLHNELKSYEDYSNFSTIG